MGTLAEISHLIRQFGRLLDEVCDGGLDESEIARLRQLLYPYAACISLRRRSRTSPQSRTTQTANGDPAPASSLLD